MESEAKFNDVRREVMQHPATFIAVRPEVTQNEATFIDVPQEAMHSSLPIASILHTKPL
jgi:hypothetical protein